MRFTITGRHIAITPSTAAYAREKIVRTFEKYFKDPKLSSAITVAIQCSRETRHHRKGNIWKADAAFTLPNQKRPLYAEAVDADIHPAIDILAEEIEREVAKYKGRSRSLMERGARRVKKELRFDPAARMYRQGRIRDEGS